MTLLQAIELTLVPWWLGSNGLFGGSRDGSSRPSFSSRRAPPPPQRPTFEEEALVFEVQARACGRPAGSVTSRGLAVRDTTASSGDGLENQLQQSLAAHLRINGKQMERMEKSFTRGRIASWSASMADLARLLDSVRGRKQIVYFSEGFDGQLLLGRQPDVLDPEQQQDQLSLQRGQYWIARASHHDLSLA